MRRFRHVIAAGAVFSGALMLTGCACTNTRSDGGCVGATPQDGRAGARGGIDPDDTDVMVPAPYWEWKSKLDGYIVCRQNSPGKGWERVGGPFKDPYCEEPGEP